MHPTVDKDPFSLTCAEGRCDRDVQRSAAYRCHECQRHYCYDHLLIDERSQVCLACYVQSGAGER